MSLIASYVVPHPPLIVKEVGKGNEKEVQNTIDSYEELGKEISNLKPDTIIISSPHATMYSDYFHISPGENSTGDFGNFNAKEVQFKEEYDTELVKEIEEIAKKENFPAGTKGEKEQLLDHGTMVPLYFIEKYYKDFKLIRIGLSNLPLIDHYKLGIIIKEALDKSDKKVIYVASGDLSHKLQTYGPYGFSKEGPIYDNNIIKTLSSGAFNEIIEYDSNFLDKAAECGHRSFTIMAGLYDKLNVETKYLSHEDITGVGYGICKFYPKEENINRNFYDTYLLKEKSRINKQLKEADDYVTLAKSTIDEYIKNNNIIEIPNNLDKEMNKKAGVFVSIHKFNELRGCIGTFLPITNSIKEEIVRNAIEAAVNDYRFNPITKEELPYLEINVDVLSTPESINSTKELDPKKYGVIVNSGSKRGLLLPDLEGVDTVEDQIRIAKNKANILSSEEITIQRFEVVRHK